MANKITGCVFDLDGTLADTAPDIALALNKSLDDVGLNRVPLESVKVPLVPPDVASVNVIRSS